MYCLRCGAQMEGQDAFCPRCGARARAARPQQPNNYAPVCGYRQPRYRGESKSKIAAGLLALFFGAVGLHNFYLCKYSSAITQLMLSTGGFVVMLLGIFAAQSVGLIVIGAVLMSVGLSIAGLWGFIEAIMLLSGAIKTDGNGIPLV